MSSDSIVLKQGKLEFRWEDGVYSIHCGALSIENCKVRMFLNDSEIAFGNWHTVSAKAEQAVFSADSLIGSWRFSVKLMQTATGVPGLSIRLQGKLNAPVRKLRFQTLSAGVPLELKHLLGLGLKMGGAQLIEFPHAATKDFKSYYLLMLTGEKEHLMISAPLRSEIMPEFTGTAAEKLHSFDISGEMLHYDSVNVDSGEISFRYGADPFRMMTDWADENTTVKKDFSKTYQIGWNSWDYYRWTVTEEEVLKNAEFIMRDPVLSQRVKRIIVDDGWQYCYGEWEANSLFPHGMKYLAQELKKMGFEPGLWFAPTIIEPHCRIAQQHPEYLAMSEGKEPCLGYECMRRFGFLLDPTVPAVQKHLYDLFDRYASMGYEYFKLDFMATTLNARRFHNQNVPRSEIPRLIVKPIYEAVTGRAAILGCNYIFGGGNEFVDAVRVGSDIHARWDKICINVVSAAANFYGNNRLWINDPDFALARGFDTSDDPDLQLIHPCTVFVKPEDAPTENAKFTLVDASRKELEVLLSIVIVGAGAMNLSDNLPKLNASGLDLLRRAVGAERGETGIPLDLFEHERPACYLQKVGNCHRLLLINWQDSEAELSFDVKAHGIDAESAVNFWNDRKETLENGVLRAKLPGRSCLLVTI